MRKGYRLVAGVCWESSAVMGERLSSAETHHVSIPCVSASLKPCRCCGHAREDHMDVQTTSGSTIHDKCCTVLSYYVGAPNPPSRVCECAEYRPAWEEYDAGPDLAVVLRAAGEVIGVLERTIATLEAEQPPRLELTLSETRYALSLLRGACQ